MKNNYDNDIFELFQKINEIRAIPEIMMDTDYERDEMILNLLQDFKNNIESKVN